MRHVPSLPFIPLRKACAALALLATATLLPACGAPAAPRAAADTAKAQCQAPCLRLIGDVVLDQRQVFGGTTIGGLSGVDYDAGRDTYILISDDRSAVDDARFYTARIRYTASTLDRPQFTAVTPLRNAAGQPYASSRRAQAGVAVPDPEAVRWLLDGTTFLWTSEGDFAHGFGPALHAARAVDGALLREYVLPAAFQPVKGAQVGSRTGPRDNATLEGLALSPDGRTAWLAMEGPWLQDGPRATPTSGGAPVRITAIDVLTGQALRQVAYQPDPVPHKSPMPGGYTTNGVSEILADGPDHLLVLERAYTLGVGNSVRLYRISVRPVAAPGHNTLDLQALAPGNHTPVAKTLVADFAHLGLQQLDNIEGMTWGPPLPSAAGGGRVLLFVSDDNFNPAQATQFIAAEYVEARATP
ncbi:MAG: esterase-like activity of phytase family protein [Gammaproteobacteria bacterium]|nr:esterase-like activity of phytase family protein [Gammaproteobacteria bacterium]MBU1504695.1 esterase-like activity of phytase family protein [Gammaproteobacteria bacterium]MBU2122594.1 esterase-like activity of phytase family protein [Gammaproteobacteria bacterium]MBU2171445.1 esterase-like activity of phytase family protein [Gammaproteobacteria bacterium]MBU2199006.1 esterase-like activity of phytase family protein [Gammaproteobacteria bacterium]